MASLKPQLICLVSSLAAVVTCGCDLRLYVGLHVGENVEFEVTAVVVSE